MSGPKRTPAHFPLTHSLRLLNVPISGLILSVALPAVALAATPTIPDVDVRWLKLSSPHFTMYTTEDKGKAIEALRTFEEARDFFAENSPAKYAPAACVEIIAFKSQKQYAPYEINQGSAAYYQRGHKCDYILMQQLGRAYLPAAIHEYTHLFVEHVGLHLPLWLNEGIADVYSSLREKDGKLMVGEPPKPRLNALLALGPLDLRTLIGATRDSPYYTKPREMAQFYATSWELAHMLLLGKHYRGNFPQFLTQVSKGKPVEQAFAEVYHKTLNAVNVDLRTYLSSNSITVTLFNIRLNGKQLQPEISNPPPLEIELVLADLLSTHRDTAQQARADLTKLVSEMPNDSSVEESLAYLAWEQGQLREAKQHFDAALRKGSKSPELLYNYSGLLHVLGAPPEEIMKVLEQALALKADYPEARFRLGMEAARQGRCAVVIETLTAMKTVGPDHAFLVFSAESFCYWRLGNPGEARRLAEMAKQYAKSPEESQRAQNLLDQINRVNPPN